MSDMILASIADWWLISSSGSANNYASQLTDFLKGSSSGSSITTKDGITFTISGQKIAYASNTWSSSNFTSLSSSAHPHKNYVGSVRIDINGISSLPNVAAEDLFFFTLYDDGSLIPVGLGRWTESDTDSSNTYNGKCDRSNNSNRLYCSGYIFDNNLKADFKID